MLKVGITGGIGSGKTTVSKLFELLGIPVYYADDRAKWLMQNDAALSKALRKEFGEDIFINDALQNNTLAAKVFNNPPALKKLNLLVHPAVPIDFENWVSEQRNVPFILHEAALIFEAGFDKYLDKIITVFAPEQLRIDRIVKRDNVTEAKVKERIKHQLPDEEKLKHSHFVIHNDERQLVIPQVLNIYSELKSLN